MAKPRCQEGRNDRAVPPERASVVITPIKQAIEAFKTQRLLCLESVDYDGLVGQCDLPRRHDGDHFDIAFYLVQRTGGYDNE